jgi:hypothetical protein
MFEMYGFIAAFLTQIILFSVLGPLRLVDGLRRQIARFIAERAPAIDSSAAAQLDRRLRLLQQVGLGTAFIGLLLLAGMIRYMLRPDWTDGPLEALAPAFFLLQVVPTFLAVVIAGRFHGLLKRSLPPEKRKALLQPRGLFDFVSRSAVALAVVVYFAFAAFLLYIDQHPFPGFAGALVNIAGVTGIYVVMSLAIYVTLRTMGSSPLQAREDRIRSVGLAVTICVYSCIVCVASLAMNMALILLDQQRWEPAFGSIGLVAIGLLMRMALSEQLRIPGGAAPTSAAPAR